MYHVLKRVRSARPQAIKQLLNRSQVARRVFGLRAQASYPVAWADARGANAHPGEQVRPIERGQPVRKRSIMGRGPKKNDQRILPKKARILDLVQLPEKGVFTKLFCAVS